MAWDGCGMGDGMGLSEGVDGDGTREATARRT